ncbi:MAG: hypothetical protein ACR5KW_01015 [Wolbachia sp.]
MQLYKVDIVIDKFDIIVDSKCSVNEEESESKNEGKYYCCLEIEKIKYYIWY